jgi:hypothetical protein
MRSKLEHVENVANQASSVMCIEVALCIQCTHLSHSRPITNVNHFQQSKIMRRRQFTLHAFTCDRELIQLKKLLSATWFCYGCVQVRGCSKGDAQCTSTELIDFSNKCRRPYGPCGTCKASLATFRGGFAIRTALWLCTYSEVGMWCSIYYVGELKTCNAQCNVQCQQPNWLTFYVLHFATFSR